MHEWRPTLRLRCLLTGASSTDPCTNLLRSAICGHPLCWTGARFWRRPASATAAAVGRQLGAMRAAAVAAASSGRSADGAEPQARTEPFLTALILPLNGLTHGAEVLHEPITERFCDGGCRLRFRILHSERLGSRICKAAVHAIASKCSAI